MELRPLDDSHYELIRSLEEQDDVWEFVGPLLLPQEGNHLFAIVEGLSTLGIGGLVRSQALGADEFELLCALKSEVQQRGLALRACELVLAWAFETAKLERVISSIDDDNEGARSVAAKLGMKPLATGAPNRTVYVRYRDEARNR